MANRDRIDTELKDLEEDQLWELVDRHRYEIVNQLHACRLTPYLRQVKVLDQTDEEEILHNPLLTNRLMKAGRLLDLLKTRGQKGALAFLESLKLHKPEIYTMITGKEPSIGASSFSDLIDTSELSEYLVTAMTELQKELAKERSLRMSFQCKFHKIQQENQELTTKNKELTKIETEYHCLQKDFTARYRDVVLLKEEQYQLSMRYTSALQEKDLAIMRCRDLQDELYKMKMELTILSAESDLERRRSYQLTLDMKPKADEVQQLKEENKFLARKILEVKSDILEHDLGEAISDKQELIKRIHSLREKADEAECQRNEYFKEKENLLIKCQQLQLDCNRYKEKNSAFQIQICALQNERDMALSARDEAQKQSALSMSEKDALRQEIITLTDKTHELQATISKLETELKIRVNGESSKSEKMKEKPRLTRMDAVSPDWTHNSNSSGSTFQSERGSDSFEIVNSFRSCTAEPPSRKSLYMRSIEDCPEIISYSGNQEFNEHDSFTSQSDLDNNDTDCDASIEDFVTLSPGCSAEADGREKSAFIFPRGRRVARRISSRVTTIAFQGDALLEQISIIGGNESGIYIHKVTPGSAADDLSLMPGTQIMHVEYDELDKRSSAILEQATLEEATWNLNQVKGCCCLSLRANHEGYQRLLKKLDNKQATSGDSFYIRVNMAMNKEMGVGLTVQCNEILHITDTLYQGQNVWYAFQVDHCSMKDLYGGIVPNYNEAQKLLINVIQDMTKQKLSFRKVNMPLTVQRSLTEQCVRIVSTDKSNINPLWTSLDGEVSVQDRTNEKIVKAVNNISCISLMPYTLVKPHKPPSRRPVLLLPSLYVKILNDKFNTLKNFWKPEREILNETEYESQKQSGNILDVKASPTLFYCLTRKGIDSALIQDAHCLLEMDIGSIKQLHREEIYPIVIYISTSEKNTKKIKKNFQHLQISEEMLLECCQREEAMLDNLPCLVNTIPADSWTGIDSLMTCITNTVREEQKKIVWIEHSPH
ncbi:caspase recruitment domain-containing protein 14 [Protopterus annectens]|uniref:caspase recruitment domain-containing protein 14 n=1 Tax=Protopterus annectens TaxID=7888 RepID=UPI001CFB82D2|nr:caspase recruitment domain-containing protein 14 [Protopterus annectens]